MYYVGIDWADDHHDICVINQENLKLGTKRISHNAEGFTTLLAFLQGFTLEPEELPICIETSGGLLVNFLLERGFNIYAVNPKTLDHKRNAAGIKTDQIDAYMLAKHLRNEINDLRRLAPDNPQIEELKALCRDQDDLIKEQTRLINQVKACLKLYYPVSLHFFSKIDQMLTLNFLLAYPKLSDVQGATVAELEQFLKMNKHPHPKKKALAIYELVHGQQLQARPSIIEAKSTLIVARVSMLKVVVEHIDHYDKKITSLFLAHPDHQIFDSLPKAGTRLSPRLLAEIGDDRDRYENERSIQALAGIAPAIKQSGKYSSVQRRIAYIKPFGQAFYQYAFSALSEKWANDYYERKRKEGKSHSMALRALANVWARIIYAMWRDRTLYDGGKFEEARKAHSGPLLSKAS